MKKQPKEAAPKKYDELIQAAYQEHVHQNSLRIMSTRKLMLFEMEELEKEVVGLQNAIARARDRKDRLAAQVKGLGLILGGR